MPIPPFDIRPAVLEIKKNDTIIMDIVFQPPAVKSYSVDMCMVCDNCNVKHFTIKGMVCFGINVIIVKIFVCFYFHDFVNYLIVEI